MGCGGGAEGSCLGRRAGNDARSACNIGGQVNRCAPTGQTGVRSSIADRPLPNIADAGSVLVVGARGVQGWLFMFPSAAPATAAKVGAFAVLPGSVIPRCVHGGGRLLIQAQCAGRTEVTCPKNAAARVCPHSRMCFANTSSGSCRRSRILHDDYHYVSVAQGDSGQRWLNSEVVRQPMGHCPCKSDHLTRLGHSRFARRNAGRYEHGSSSHFRATVALCLLVCCAGYV